jgi:glycosyltransferase involved in cell wall biosynthesis
MITKVLYIITKSDVGGAQKYVNDLADNLDKSRFEAKVVFGGQDIKWLSNKVWPWALFLNDWLAVFEIAKLVKKERPDVLHLNSSKAGVIGAMAARLAMTKKIKVVFTAHGWIFNPTNAISRPARRFYILLHKFAALFQDKIICVSEYDYNLALRYGIAPKEKLITIHNGINADIKFLSKEKAREEIIKKLSIFNDQFSKKALWVGSIGRLVKEKNYETMIRAAARIKEGVNFILIGDGPQREELEKQVAKNKLRNDFLIIEPSGDDAKYLKAFDVFVMSSIKEGLPYILLEAMAAGLPIVVTEAGGIPEMIKNHENGLMVAQKNPEQLAIAIQGILENKNISKELGEQAKKAVDEKFSLEEMVEKTEKIYLSRSISDLMRSS